MGVILTHYWDHQLIFYIKYWFLMDIVMGSDILITQTSITNHTSAVNYAESVKTCIFEEGNHNAILGPIV